MTRKKWNTVDRLIYLANGGDPSLRGAGICHDIYSNCKDVSLNRLRKALNSHPEFSGNTCYPVPYPGKRLSAEDAYYFISDLWVGEYGALRRDFARHAAEVLSGKRVIKSFWSRFTFWK